MTMVTTQYTCHCSRVGQNASTTYVAFLISMLVSMKKKIRKYHTENILAPYLIPWTNDIPGFLSLGIQNFRLISQITYGPHGQSSIIQVIITMSLKHSARVLITIHEKRVRKHLSWKIPIMGMLMHV